MHLLLLLQFPRLRGLLGMFLPSLLDAVPVCSLSSFILCLCLFYSFSGLVGDNKDFTRGECHTGPVSALSDTCAHYPLLCT